MQYATEKNRADLEIRVYPGANGSFTLYEDENDNYNYEKGIYSTITFDWDDQKRTLIIDSRKGTFPGMLKNRKFNIVVVGEGTAVENDKVATSFDKIVSYSGKKSLVKF